MRARSALPLAFLALAACSGGSGGPTAIEIPIDRREIAGGCAAYLLPDERCQLQVRAITAQGQIVTNPVVRWASTDAGVASVDARGRVTARGPGAATIRVSNTTDTAIADRTVNVLTANPK